MKKLLAFHNDQKIKDFYIARVTAHYEADEIIKGKYWQNGKGCAVGCTLHNSNHADYEKELGIPIAIARLEDRLFEGLPNAQAKEFPLRFLEAIRVGADLSMVVPKFIHWLLVDPEDGVVRFSFNKPIVQAVATLYERKINGETISSNEWFSIRKTAAAAASASASAYAAAAAYAYASAAAASAADADAADDATADAAAYAADASASTSASAAAAAYAADAAYAYAAYAADDDAAAAAAYAADDAAAYVKNKVIPKQAAKFLELLTEAI